MRPQLLGGVVLVGVLALTSVSPAEEKVAKEEKVDYEKVAAGGPGVSNVVRDRKGRIVSVLIVGRSRISTVLGAAKGKEVAQQRASLMADAEFSKWLGSKVEVHESDKNETTLFLEGSEENDKEALRESGKAVEKTSAEFKRISRSFIRGLQVVYREVSGKKKELTLVKKWRAKTAEAIEKIGKDGDKKDGARKDGAKKDGGKRKKDDKVIEDEKTTIKE